MTWKQIIGAYITTTFFAVVYKFTEGTFFLPIIATLIVMTNCYLHNILKKLTNSSNERKEKNE